jgi:hypothetical protein
MYAECNARILKHGANYPSQYLSADITACRKRKIKKREKMKSIFSEKRNGFF